MGETAQPGIAAVVPSPTREDASLQHLEQDHGTGHRSRRVGAGAWAILWPAIERSNPTRRTPPLFGWQNPTRNHPVGKEKGACIRLSAYLPQEGVVLAQMQVKTVGNEVSSAPVLLASLDLRGTVVSGDANFAASALSETILQAKGDYRMA